MFQNTRMVLKLIIRNLSNSKTYRPSTRDLWVLKLSRLRYVFSQTLICLDLRSFLNQIRQDSILWLAQRINQSAFIFQKMPWLRLPRRILTRLMTTSINGLHLFKREYRATTKWIEICIALSSWSQKSCKKAKTQQRKSKDRTTQRLNLQKWRTSKYLRLKGSKKLRNWGKQKKGFWKRHHVLAQEIKPSHQTSPLADLKLLNCKPKLLVQLQLYWSNSPNFITKTSQVPPLNWVRQRVQECLPLAILRKRRL